MKGLLEQVNALDHLIRSLHKIDSKLRAGQIIDAWREVNRLIGSLRVNSSRTRKILEWNPPFSLDEGLEKTVRWYLKNR